MSSSNRSRRVELFSVPGRSPAVGATGGASSYNQSPALHQRSTTAAAYGSGGNTSDYESDHARYNGGAYQQHQQQQNQVGSYAEAAGISSLHSKVQLLKDFSIEMGDEIRDQNREFGDTMNDFERTGGLLSTTVRQFQDMAARQGGGYMFLLFLFAMVALMVVYFLAKRI